MNYELLILIGLLAAAAALIWLAFRPWRRERAERERLTRLMGRDLDATEVDAPARPSGLRRTMLSAGIDANPAIVVAIFAVVAIAIGFLLASMFGGSVIIGAVAAGLALWLFFAATSEAARMRTWRFESRFVDAIDLSAGALAAGEEPADAFEHAAEASQSPVREELLELVNKIRSSVPIESAVQPMAERYDCEAVRLFTQLLIAKWEIGGQLAPALKDISRTVRNGVRLRRQLHASVSSAQVAGLIVAIAPYLLLLIFLARRPEMVSKLWAYAYGPQLFFTAVMLQVIGLMWLRRLLRTEL